MKEIREAKPMPRTEQEAWCGPANIEFILRKHGHKVYQETLARLLNTTFKDGTAQDKMLEVVHHFGLEAFDTTYMTLDEINDLITQGWDAIINWMTDPSDEENNGHYSGLIYADREAVVLNDTTRAGGVVSIWRRSDFEKLWYDVDHGRRIDNWAMLIRKANGRLPSNHFQGKNQI